MRFEGVLFSTDPVLVREATAAGVRAFAIDWEWIGKDARQVGADTQINYDTPEDLRRVRAATDAVVLCRINRVGPTTAEEIEQAIDGGADEILVPMVRAPRQVETVLRLVRGRVGVGILVETAEAVARTHELAKLPLSRVYVGLNDLSIERGSPTLFSAVADGTVEAVGRAFSCPFGFGGLTVVDRGEPVPARLLIAEMARLACSFSFMRRSFLRDVVGRDMRAEVVRIDDALTVAARRTPAEVLRDRTDLAESIERWERTRMATAAARGSAV